MPHPSAAHAIDDSHRLTGPVPTIGAFAPAMARILRRFRRTSLTNTLGSAILSVSSLSDYPSVEEEEVRQQPTKKTRRLSVAGATLAVATLMSGHALAQEPLPPLSAPADVAPEVLERSLYKTLVFEGTTNTIDLLLFGSILGGHIYAGPAFLAVNATAAVLLYYGHEVAWGYLGPPEPEYDLDTNILKGLTFRMASSTRAFAVGLGFTGDPIAASGFMVASAVGETVVYVANEYGWAYYDDLRQTGLTTPLGMLPAVWQGAAVSR